MERRGGAFTQLGAIAGGIGALWFVGNYTMQHWGALSFEGYFHNNLQVLPWYVGGRLLDNISTSFVSWTEDPDKRRIPEANPLAEASIGLFWAGVQERKPGLVVASAAITVVEESIRAGISFAVPGLPLFVAAISAGTAIDNVAENA